MVYFGVTSQWFPHIPDPGPGCVGSPGPGTKGWRLRTHEGRWSKLVPWFRTRASWVMGCDGNDEFMDFHGFSIEQKHTKNDISSTGSTDKHWGFRKGQWCFLFCLRHVVMFGEGKQNRKKGREEEIGAEGSILCFFWIFFLGRTSHSTPYGAWITDSTAADLFFGDFSMQSIHLKSRATQIWGYPNWRIYLIYLDITYKGGIIWVMNSPKTA